jgi:hypothetical protein
LSTIAYLSKSYWLDKLKEKYSLGIEKLGSLKTEEISFYQALTEKQRKTLVK